MNFKRSLVAQNLLALSFAVPFFVSAHASADEACGDETCPKGYECQTYNLGCPEIDCADADCPPCAPSVGTACVPLPCTSDSDCASDMVCFTETHDECDEAPTCARDDAGEDSKVPPECEPVNPTNCTSVTNSACVPRWYLPCQTASDCGPGFTCEEQLQGGCPGSMGSGGGSTPSEGSAEPARPAPPQDGGAGEPAPSDNPVPAPDEPPAADGGTDGCVFEPSGVSACVRVEIGCSANSDCPAGWSCDTNHEGACWASADGSMGCDPVDPPQVCYPPYEDLGGRGVAGSDSGSATGGGNPDGAAEPPVAPKGDDNHGADADADSEMHTAEAGGCSVSPARGAGTGLGLLVLALAGLFGARRRR